MDAKQRQEEARQRQEEAKKQVDAILDSSRPKNLAHGVTSGVGNILTGAIGSVGTAVLLPTAGLVCGLKNGGIIGGVLGVAGGAVAGALGASAFVIGGTLQGVTQILRGIVAIPGSIRGPITGKWWNEVEGKWIETNLENEAKLMSKVPIDDSDILGSAISDVEAQLKTRSSDGAVKDRYYYDILEVDPKAELSIIKRQYYCLAKRYHPDKCEEKDVVSANKFKEIGEAYQVLSDPTLRSKYDVEGRDGLSATRTSLADSHHIDPTMLFAFLFGSDKFNDYIGRMSMATSAMVGDSQKVSLKNARILQKRRCTRLAILLVQRLQLFVTGEIDAATSSWSTEATALSKTSYGYELIQLIGRTYSAVAAQFLGSFDSGIGMPSISEWAQCQLAQIKKKHDKTMSKISTMKAGMQMLDIKEKSTEALASAETEEARREVETDLERENLNVLLQILWTVTSVDVTSTLHETCQMVFFDKAPGVDKDLRRKRALGVQKLGEVFVSCPIPDEREQEKDAKQLYEEAAFSAMLEMIKKKEEEAHRVRPV